MLITRHIDESICINHQVCVTVHEIVGQKTVLYIEDVQTGESRVQAFSIAEELEISDYGTLLCPTRIDENGVTFEIHHDPQVVVHRMEEPEVGLH